MLGVAGNVLSGNIGEHYEKEAKPVLDLKGTQRNAGALVALETYHWKNTQHEGSRELGSAMTELQRFGVLMHTQKALAKGEQPLPFSLAFTALKNAVFNGQAAGFETVARTGNLSPEEMKGFNEGVAIFEKVKSEHTDEKRRFQPKNGHSRAAKSPCGSGVQGSLGNRAEGLSQRPPYETREIKSASRGYTRRRVM